MASPPMPAARSRSTANLRPRSSRSSVFTVFGPDGGRDRARNRPRTRDRSRIRPRHRRNLHNLAQPKPAHPVVATNLTPFFPAPDRARNVSFRCRRRRPGSAAWRLPGDPGRISPRNLLGRRKVSQAPGRAGGLCSETVLWSRLDALQGPKGRPKAGTDRQLRHPASAVIKRILATGAGREANRMPYPAFGAVRHAPRASQSEGRQRVMSGMEGCPAAQSLVPHRVYAGRSRG